MEENIEQKETKLHKYLFTVTTFSKLLAMFLFVVLPFVGFYLGMRYQGLINQQVVPQTKSEITFTRTSPKINTVFPTNQTENQVLKGMLQELKAKNNVSDGVISETTGYWISQNGPAIPLKGLSFSLWAINKDDQRPTVSVPVSIYVAKLTDKYGIPDESPIIETTQKYFESQGFIKDTLNSPLITEPSNNKVIVLGFTKGDLKCNVPFGIAQPKSFFCGTVDNNQLTKNQAFLASFSKSLKQGDFIYVVRIEGDFASVDYGQVYQEGPSASWIAKKINGVWQLIMEQPQQMISCSDPTIQKYQIPQTFTKCENMPQQ